MKGVARFKVCGYIKMPPALELSQPPKKVENFSSKSVR
jgi:hypothetical protein